MARLSLVVVAFLAFGAMGCSSNPCEDLCEKGMKCPGMVDGPTSLDTCVSQCDQMMQKMDNLGCGSEAEDMYGCVADQDVCNLNETTMLSACSDESVDFVACWLPKCMDAESNPDCNFDGPI